MKDGVGLLEGPYRQQVDLQLEEVLQDVEELRVEQQEQKQSKSVRPHLGRPVLHSFLGSLGPWMVPGSVSVPTEVDFGGYRCRGTSGLNDV